MCAFLLHTLIRGHSIESAGDAAAEKIRQEIICRHTHSHTYTHMQKLTWVAWLENEKNLKRDERAEHETWFIMLTLWNDVEEHFSCLSAGISIVCHLIMHSVAQPQPSHLSYKNVKYMWNLLTDAQQFDR